MTRPKPQLSIFAFILSPEDPGGWDFTFDLVRAADRAGVDRAVLTGEHVVFGERLEAYAEPAAGGRIGGKQPTGPDGHFLDPFIAAASMFAMTSRIRLATNVILAPLRRPIVLAKTAATVDVLSKGRFDLGVGVGWQIEEYQAAGVPFEKRGRLLDHALEVCDVLWREQRASYSSPELTFENIHQMPKPVTPGGVPVWIGGNVIPPVMRRLARFGSGWLPWGGAGQDNAELLKEIPLMREAVAAHGRDPMEIQISGDLPIVRGADGEPQLGPTMDRVADLAAAGITDFRAKMAWPRDPEAAEEMLRAWAGGFRAATT